MTRHWFSRVCSWLTSLSALVSGAWAQDLGGQANVSVDAAKGVGQQIGDNQLWGAIDRTARGPVDTSKFSCNADSASPFPELDKAKAALRAKYPKLPWSELSAVAEEVAKHDMAIELGTNCQNYVFETYLRALEAATFAGHKCEAKTDKIDLAQCLQDVTCEKGGRYSRFCGAKFSWER